MIVNTFILLPFCYFFSESNNDFDEVSTYKKIKISVKNLIFFLCFVSACLILSLYFKEKKVNEKDLEFWNFKLINS